MTGADPVRAAARRLAAEDFLRGWTVRAQPASSALHAGAAGADFWTSYSAPNAREASSGFKIHVSASIASAADVLLRAAPAFGRMGVPFKHASSLDRLATLSSGAGGATQVGKFLTAYPPDPETARRLADRLHELTQGLPGPRIASEQQLCPGSLVHYRYGAFVEQWLQLPTGRIAPARLGPRGLEPDERGAGPGDGAPPSPFGAPTDGVDGETRTLLAERYVRMRPLHESPKGNTWLGFDQDSAPAEDPERRAMVVIKEAFAFVMEASDGLDAVRRLEREALRIRALQDSGLTPVFVDYWREVDRAFLVYRLVEGPTLASIINSLRDEGLSPPATLLRDWAQRLADAVAEVHGRGFVLGDIKPSNIVFADGGFRFIDLELAGTPTTAPCGGMGTPGYCSPEQADPDVGRSFQQDVYSIGATLLAASTLTDASSLPDLSAVAAAESRRHGAPIHALIRQCLARDPGSRPESAVDLAARCRALDGVPAAVRDTVVDAQPGVDFGQLAADVGDLLLHAARSDGSYTWWESGHATVGLRAVRDLYAGSCGTALFLWELYEQGGDERYLDAARRCGEWLWRTDPEVPRQVEMPGLYFGEAGPGLLYLRLHEATDEPVWLTRARRASARVAAMPHHSPDLMTGAAGSGLFHLALWSTAGDTDALDRARWDAAWLLDRRVGGRPSWAIPPEHETLSDTEYLGFAHGSAGIGHFLAELCAAAPDPALRQACAETADWLLEHAQPCLPDQRGLRWPNSPGDSAGIGVYWCHGAAGVARFLAHAGVVLNDARYLDAAIGAARSIAAARWSGTTQCHGLAGNIDVLVDVWQCVGGRWLDVARNLGQDLLLYRTERGWPSESSLVYSPDLVVGQAGVGAAFARLAAPHRQHVVTARVSRGCGPAEGQSVAPPLTAREFALQRSSHAKL